MLDMQGVFQHVVGVRRVGFEDINDQQMVQIETLQKLIREVAA